MLFKKIKTFFKIKTNIILLIFATLTLLLSVSLIIIVNKNKNLKQTNNELQIKNDVNNEVEDTSTASLNENKTSENKNSSTTENKDTSNTTKTKDKNSSKTNESEKKASTNTAKEENKKSTSTTNVEDKPSSNTTKVENKPSSNATKVEDKPSSNATKVEDNKVYLCPSGYTLSSDKNSCYKISELVKKYKCKNNYTLNSDNTCTGIIKRKAEKNIKCKNNDFSGWEKGSNEPLCYTNGETWITESNCTYNYFVTNGSLYGCYNERYNPIETDYICPRTWSKDPNDNTSCYKYETINAEEYYGCDDGYELNSTKDSCIKTIASTIK